ncbi:hypothetical protein GCM10010123_41910 [Pilimelia anulata]|uniref:Uncharacterized protein n=1 Tax=Pilimelia anulata TaxID=53371 RepID=A0A8J3BAG2_9ACTN|nr:hypothetical protein GCM10010123_41910 [Pilimelia anulata]
MDRYTVEPLPDDGSAGEWRRYRRRFAAGLVGGEGGGTAGLGRGRQPRGWMSNVPVGGCAPWHLPETVSVNVRPATGTKSAL